MAHQVHKFRTGSLIFYFNVYLSQSDSVAYSDKMIPSHLQHFNPTEYLYAPVYLTSSFVQEQAFFCRHPCKHKQLPLEGFGYN